MMNNSKSSEEVIDEKQPAEGFVSQLHGKGRYDILLENGSVTAFSSRKMDLSVGDKVILHQKDNNIVIVDVYERRTEIRKLTGDTRKRLRRNIQEQVVAANVDVGVIVAPIKQPSFHSRFVDRYLVVMQNSEVSPVICINKIDLERNLPSEISAYRNIGVPIIETSAHSLEGIDELKEAVRGKVSVLVGHSGTGKSSLINALKPEAGLATRAVNKKTGSGKHTTSAIGMYGWEKRSYIIDTPGIRSLGVGNIPKEQLRLLFPEFQEFSSSCRFRNCQHDHEPDCAVKEAVEQGLIPDSRYESYQRMLME